MMSLYPKSKIFEKIHKGIHESVYIYDANIKSYLKKFKNLKTKLLITHNKAAIIYKFKNMRTSNCDPELI